MPHDYAMPPPAKGPESKGKGKIKSINIETLDDGTFMYKVYTDKMECRSYSYQSVKNLLSAVRDDVTSPHIREEKKGLAGDSTPRLKVDNKKGKLELELRAK